VLPVEVGLAELIYGHLDYGEEAFHVQHNGAPFMPKDHDNSVVVEGHLLGKSSPNKSHQALKTQ
jgi:hypothetical protein